MEVLVLTDEVWEEIVEVLEEMKYKVGRFLV